MPRHLTDEGDKAASCPGNVEEIENASCELELMEEGRLFGKYVIGQLIGKGAFGSVSECQVKGRSKKYAVKVHSHAHSEMLKHEREIYVSLGRSTCYPTLVDFVVTDAASFLIMELLDGSMGSMERQNSRRILLCGLDVLSAIRHMHSIGFVHRDLKPDNFMIRKGKGSGYTVVLGDFGLATSYIQPSGLHVPIRKTSGVGTLRYASVNVGRGIIPSRRDDIEALAYSLLELYIARLPWSGISVSSQQTRAGKVSDIKASTNFFALSAPSEIGSLVKYSRLLGYEEEPDYEYISDMIRGRLAMEKRRPPQSDLKF